MELYLKNWYNKLLSELTRTQVLRIVSPFVKEQVIRKIQDKFPFSNFELITRFNLSEFASNISSLDGLRFAVESGAKVYGIRDLHSKIYIFDSRSAIITSANLTTGGLVNNYECGIYITNSSTIQSLHRYLDDLKSIAERPLTLGQCEAWQRELEQMEIVNTKIPSYQDYGAAQVKTDPDKNYYVKFFGTANSRKSMTFTVREEIDRALCHYACGFSPNKKPRQINDRDIIYMARLTENPNNLAIFGKAETIKFVDKRDRATPKEIVQRPWKKEWPIYLRVTNPVFVDGILGDCVFLYDLINELDYESFATTKRRYEDGQRNINPYRSLSQQAYVKLTVKATDWLESRFQDTLSRLGKVSDQFIGNLPKSEIDIGRFANKLEPFPNTNIV